jgi:hypothetical protein
MLKNMQVYFAVAKSYALWSKCFNKGTDEAQAEHDRQPYYLNVADVGASINDPVSGFHHTFRYGVEMCMCQVKMVPAVSPLPRLTAPPSPGHSFLGTKKSTTYKS